MFFNNEVLILSGTANVPLAERIAQNLGLKLADMQIRRFADNEVFVQIEESVRSKDTYVIQPTGNPSNENWMELFLIIDALKRADAKSITAVVPYYGYCRQDRKNEPRVPITAKLVANLLAASGPNRLVALDLHVDQIQGFFDIPIVHTRARNVFLERFNEIIIDKENLVVVSPDVGGVARARGLAKSLGTDLAIVDKRRDRANECEVVNIVGDVKNKDVVIIDDIIDTGGSLIKSAIALKEMGVRKIYVFATHAVFSGDVYERLNDGIIDKVFITDSIKTDASRLGDKIEILSVAPLLASAIKHIHLGLSVSTIFDR